MNEPGTGIRALRVATAVRARLSEMLVRDVQDPALAGVVITDVRLSDDLGIVWVKARLLAGTADPARRRKVVSHLARAGGRLRRGLGRDLQLKRTPELRFDYDTGVDAEERVLELLGEIDREKGSKI